eukprot:15477513-Alexandrium_andersonii.AAC.1
MPHSTAASYTASLHRKLLWAMLNDVWRAMMCVCVQCQACPATDRVHLNRAAKPVCNTPHATA